MKKTLVIQSTSDIITNSSSEVFVVIHSSNREFIDELYSQLDSIYGWNQESERTPVIEYEGQTEHDNWEYDYERRYTRADEEPVIDKSTISIEMPYYMRNAISYHRAGIEALVEEGIKKHNVDRNDLKVEFNEEF